MIKIHLLILKTMRMKTLCFIRRITEARSHSLCYLRKMPSNTEQTLLTFMKQQHNMRAHLTKGTILYVIRLPVENGIAFRFMFNVQHL